MSFKDWCQVIGFSVLTLLVVALVMNGFQAVIIDTGHAIVH